MIQTPGQPFREGKRTFPEGQVAASLLGVLIFVLFALLLIGCSPLIHPVSTPSAQDSSSAEITAPDGQLIVQISYPLVDRLNQLAAELDVWEVDRSAQTLVAKVTLEQYTALLAQKLPVVLDCDKMRQYAEAIDLTLPAIADLMSKQCP